MAKINESGKQIRAMQQAVAGVRPYVATPAYNGKVDTDYAMSLADSCMVASALGVPVTAAIMGNGAFIELARNNFVRMFLETECTHLFFIDADLKWEPRAFIGILASGKPVAAGMYRRRQDPEEYPVRYKEAEEGGLMVVDGGWVECSRVPTGFLCIERSVVEEMAKDAPKWKQHGVPDAPRLFYTQEVETEDENRYLFMGEDFSWCDDYCERYNTHIYVWPDFDFVHGGYECNWHKFLNKKIEEFEREEKEHKIVAVAR